MEMFKFGTWVSCQVKSGYMLSYKNLTMNGQCVTEEKTVGNEKFVAMTGIGPMGLSLTAVLDARTGADVYGLATHYLGVAHNGKTGKIYFAKYGQLYPFTWMMTNAEISEYQVNPNGQWIHAEVKMTFKQASKWDGSTNEATAAAAETSKSSGGSGGSTKTVNKSSSSVKKSSGAKVNCERKTALLISKKLSDIKTVASVTSKTTPSISRTLTTVKPIRSVNKAETR